MLKTIFSTKGKQINVKNELRHLVLLGFIEIDIDL